VQKPKALHERATPPYRLAGEEAPYVTTGILCQSSWVGKLFKVHSLGINESASSSADYGEYRGDGKTAVENVT